MVRVLELPLTLPDAGPVVLPESMPVVVVPVPDVVVSSVRFFAGTAGVAALPSPGYGVAGVAEFGGESLMLRFAMTLAGILAASFSEGFARLRHPPAP